MLSTVRLPARYIGISACPGCPQGGRATDAQIRDRRRTLDSNPRHSDVPNAVPRDTKQSLDRFLAGVERRAYVSARLATRDGEEALDIVQDAMLVMVRSYAGRPEPEWGPLFHSVLQSRINDWRRRTRVRLRWRVWLGRDEDTDDDPLQNLPDRASADPAAQAAGRKALGALEQALSALPARQREAFLLRAWEGFDTAQTARAMDCSEGSVKTHYSRAVQALRAQLGEHWP